MKHGARNDIVGEVVDVQQEDAGLMALAKVKISGDSVVSSVMTKESLAELGIRPGDNVRVIVKAVNVLLIKDS